MEKIENRQKFYKVYHEILHLVKLTPEFINGLEQHQYFKVTMPLVEQLAERDQLNFILLELTRERSTCQAVINLLDDCKQTEAARKLAQFNISDGPMALVWDEKLEVARGFWPNIDMSNCYNLSKTKRGKWIIVNNVEEPFKAKTLHQGLKVDARGLAKETVRFEDLFTQLHFEVQVFKKLSAKQLEIVLQDIAQTLDSADEAFGLMVITHGEDEKIYGHEACEKLARIKRKELTGDDPAAKQVLSDDKIDISEIIKIFSDHNCPQLEAKPKIFFFTCCRAKDSPQNDSESGLANVWSGPTSAPSGVETRAVSKSNIASTDTFVAYSCAKGYETFFDDYHGLSYFGQALSHSIAQYARQESLSQIMSRTQTRLAQIMKGKWPNQEVGNYATETVNYAMSRQLYFNPGITK